ncbi:GntR family transcriptional regulator [Mycobacterium sp. URHB0021]
MSADAVGASPATRPDVYDQIRWDIVHGVLRPNEALVETDLAERLGVSRTPVRESLLRLAANGLIISRRRRWYVYEHTADEIKEIYEVRAANEGYAARLCCERASDEQLQAIALAHTAVDRASAEERVSANDAFHDQINSACGNQRLIKLITENRLFHFNLRLAAAYTPEELDRSSQQHTELIAAVLARDGDRAEAVVRTHVLEAAVMARRVAR